METLSPVEPWDEPQSLSACHNQSSHNFWRAHESSLVLWDEAGLHVHVATKTRMAFTVNYLISFLPQQVSAPWLTPALRNTSIWLKVCRLPWILSRHFGQTYNTLTSCICTSASLQQNFLCSTKINTGRASCCAMRGRGFSSCICFKIFRFSKSLQKIGNAWLTQAAAAVPCLPAAPSLDVLAGCAKRPQPWGAWWAKTTLGLGQESRAQCVGSACQAQLFVLKKPFRKVCVWLLCSVCGISRAPGLIRLLNVGLCFWSTARTVRNSSSVISLRGWTANIPGRKPTSWFCEEVWTSVESQ